MGSNDFILVRDVVKTYGIGKNMFYALKKVSFRVSRGEFIALLGPSGSGKTTLIHILGGIDIPTSGSVVIDGVEISSQKDKWRTIWRRHNVGIIFQFFHLIPLLTAIENVMYPLELIGLPKKERRRRACELLRYVGLKDKAERFPSELSGGEQQRVAVARALAADPPLILADEPTANLDTSNKEKIVDLLRGVKDMGKTVIMATHDLELAMRADRILTIKDGMVGEE